MSAQLSITLFILASTGFLVVLPFFKELSKNNFLNLILKRSCWVLGTYLMVLNSGIMMSIADAAGMNISADLIRYMWLFGWGGYLLMIVLVLGTLLETLRLWQLKKHKKQFGDDDGQE